ncbi:MAG: peroxiredoxin [Crocinitomicaceae bacterium]|nr:peroxiredoxin [Crocinitomicaceae bacterium]
MAVKIGDKCPSFKLKNQHGELIDTAQWIGKQKMVIYFYPKDQTTGCTRQACSFRDAYEDFKEIGAEVIGISGDDEQSHRRFAEKYQLPFILLADERKVVRRLFDVPTNLFGFLPGRVTYIIDEQGIVRDIFNAQLNIEGHIQRALAVLK